MKSRVTALLGLFCIVWALLMAGAHAQSALTPLQLSAVNEENYHRLFFSGDVPLSFKTVLRKNLLSIRFDRPVDIDTALLVDTLPEIVSQASMTPDNRQLLVRLRSDLFRIRNFTSDEAFGIDLVDSDSSAGLQTLMSVPFLDQKRSTDVAENAGPIGPNQPEEEEVTISDEPLFDKAPEFALKPEFAERMLRRKDLEESRDLRTDPVFKEENGRYTLSFEWGTRVSATVFKRGGNYLWIVFDEYAVLPEEAFANVLDPNVMTFEGRVPSQRSTILRFKSDKLQHIRTYRDRRTWNISFGKPGAIPNPPAKLIPAYDAEDLARINVPVRNIGRIIKLIDPLVGDELMIIPLYEPYYTDQTHNFIDMAMLQTAQGIAVQLISDGIRFERSEDLSYLQFIKPTKHSHGGVTAPVLALAYSEPALYPPMPDRASKETKKVVIADKSSMFDFDEWKHGTPYNFVKTKQELLQTIALTTDENERNIYRLELAQFYFSHALYREALAVIGVMHDSVEYPIENEAVLMLEGASYYLDGRYEEALEVFEKIIPELVKKENNRNEIAFWKEATKLQLGKEGAKFSYADYQNSFPLSYPKDIRYSFALLSVEDRIVQDDFDTAIALLEHLNVPEQRNLPKHLKNRAKYLQGLIALEEDDYDFAMELWSEVEDDVKDRYNRARSAFSLTKLLYQLDEIDLETATKRFDDLRAVWRGDGIELELLSLVGGIYINEQRYLEGLRTLREALTYYPGSEAALFITNQMTRTFIDLFREQKAREAGMDPLEALSLYYEFRELTPIGEPGDKVIQSLAEWLVDADLLDRAAALLTHQIKYRVRGEERSRVAARLAEIHMLNRNYKLALEAITTTRRIENPLTLKQHRLFLEGRLLIELGEYDKALQLLRNHPHPSAVQLRGMAYWYKGDWENTVAELNPFFAKKRSEDTMLTPQETQSLILLSMAHSFLRDSGELFVLQEDFINRIPKEMADDKELFTFIVGAAQPVDHRAFDETLKADMLREFLEGYEVTVQMPNPEEEGAL